MNGHIYLDRKILDWEWYSNLNTCRLFIHLLLKANWKDVRWQGQDIKRGQLVASIPSLSEETALTPKEVRVALNHLIETGEVGRQTTNRYSVITVNKYDEYQSEGRQRADKGQSKGSLRATNEEEEEINNISCAPEPHDKKDRAIDERKLHNFEQIYKAYPKKKGRQDALNHYLGWISSKGRCINGRYIKLTNKQMYAAVRKYVKQMQDEEKELQYYQGFDRFMNKTILDYVEGL